MPFGGGGRSPLETLALPGIILAYKYSQFRQRRREAANRRVTERELSALHYKIDKLLSKLEESEPEPPTSQEDECVICINARATMETSPCGHRVVCRRCFVKTIQSAVAQRMLPLRCVICRARINRLTSGSGSWQLQGSASTYSMSSKSWGMPGSASSYSMGARVAQSYSLYSMSSGVSNYSGNSTMSTGSSTSGRSNASSSCSSQSSTASSVSSSANHRHNSSCSSGCLGAIPRNPSYKNNNFSDSSSSASSICNRISNSSSDNKINQTRVSPNGGVDGHYSSFPRTGRNRHSDFINNNRLPTIKEFRSPARIPANNTNNPVPPSVSSPALQHPTTTNNSKIRFASYTGKSSISSKSKDTRIELHDDKLKNNSMSSGGVQMKMTSLIEGGGSKSLSSGNGPSKLSGKTLLNKSAGGSASLISSAKDINNNYVAGKSKYYQCLNPDDLKATKADNKKNELMERKRKEDKAKQKAEKEARKEEKRLAKEDEKLAKILAKEEKKRLMKS